MYLCSTLSDSTVEQKTKYLHIGYILSIIAQFEYYCVVCEVKTVQMSESLNCDEK